MHATALGFAEHDALAGHGMEQLLQEAFFGLVGDSLEDAFSAVALHVPLAPCGRVHLAEVGAAGCHDGLRLAEDRGSGRNDRHAVLLHLEVDALGVVEDGAEGDGLAEGGIRHFDHIDANRVFVDLVGARSAGP